MILKPKWPLFWTEFWAGHQAFKKRFLGMQAYDIEFYIIMWMEPEINTYLDLLDI